MVAWHAQGAAREPQARFARVRSHEDGQRKKGGRCGGGGGASAFGAHRHGWWRRGPQRSGGDE